jgi:peroxiredoxin
MRTMILCFACVWVMDAPTPAKPVEFAVTPRWATGQELVYRGSVVEMRHDQGVRFTKNYRLELRTLVLNHDPREGFAEVAFMTKLSLPQGINALGGPETASLRVDVGTVDGQGRLLAASAADRPGPAVDGPTTWEASIVVESPEPRVRLNQTWSAVEDGATKRVEVLGPGNWGGVACVKVKITRQSEDWDQPRGDRAAWKCEETIWIHQRLGVAQKVERVLLRRNAAQKEPTYRLTTDFDLDSSIRYDGLFLEDRVRDIRQTRQFHEQAQQMAQQPPKNGAKAYETVLARLDQYTSRHAATPYREGLLRVRGQLLAGAQNRLSNLVVPAATEAEGLTVGKLAPDFVIRDLDGKQAVTLRSWRGRPVLMVFFQPAATSALVVLNHLQRHMGQWNEWQIQVVGLAMTDDRSAIESLRTNLNLTLPILAGKSLRRSFDVEATPSFVVLDHQGVVRAIHAGWGPETAAQLTAVLQQLKDAKPPLAP